jgi:signal transduction histidine kinase
MSLVMMVNTGKRRELLAGARRLELALGATDQVLDMAMQRALTTTLLGLGNFLHELRNTQTAIRLNLEMLERDALDEAQRGQTLEIALEAARSQQALLDDTLEALRRQAQPREGARLVVGEVLEHTLRGRPDGLIIDYRSQAPHFEVQGEPSHLATVLRNLLRNARQAGATRVEIETRLYEEHDSIAIAVSDDGPGIAPERAAQLFRPFVTEGKKAGTGLGLYLCRRYVELMNGEIQIDNGAGGGARFTIRLPGARAQTASRAS